MKKVKTKCHLCNDVTKSEEAPELCPSCGTSITEQNENVVKSSRAQFVTGKVYGGWDGVLYLTNERLFFYKISKIGGGVGGALGGAVGGLIEGAINASKRSEAIAFSLPFNEITSVEIKKRGLLGKDLFINTTTGESHKIQAPKVAEWEAAINGVL